MFQGLQQSEKRGSSIGSRLFMIIGLTLLLLIPSFMIRGLINERQARRDNVVNDIAYKWSGGRQTIAGPILTVPFKRYYKDGKGKTRTVTHYAHFLPEKLSIEGTIVPEIRYRSIYKVVLYHADLHFEGEFSNPDIGNLNISRKNALFKDAFLQIGMTNVKGIKEPIQIVWNESKLVADPGVKSNDVVTQGVSTNVSLSATKDNHKFSFDAKFNGHQLLSFAPVGNETKVKISSSWNSPSFMGDFLPVTRKISEKGFSAKWKVINLNRSFPQAWIGNAYHISSSFFGVKLFKSVDHYQKVMRTVKYAIMFIALTFLAFFLIEVLNQSRVKKLHPIQYLLIGSGLVLFYSLLLSLSEHIMFFKAYLLASVAVVILIALYSRTLLASNSLARIIAAILVVFYTHLYIVLQLEDYALLIGSIGLFCVLAFVMYLTRNIDWSKMGELDK